MDQLFAGDAVIRRGLIVYARTDSWRVKFYVVTSKTPTGLPRLRYLAKIERDGMKVIDYTAKQIARFRGSEPRNMVASRRTTNALAIDGAHLHAWNWCTPFISEQFDAAELQHAAGRVLDGEEPVNL